VPCRPENEVASEVGGTDVVILGKRLGSAVEANGAAVHEDDAVGDCDRLANTVVGDEHAKPTSLAKVSNEVLNFAN